MDSTGANILILVSCILGLVYALIHAVWLSKLKFRGGGSYEDERKADEVMEVGSYIENGAKAFLLAEYKYIGVFVIIMAIIIFVSLILTSVRSGREAWAFVGHNRFLGRSHHIVNRRLHWHASRRFLKLSMLALGSEFHDFGLQSCLLGWLCHGLHSYLAWTACTPCTHCCVQ